jgi:hypothetical protein
MALTGDRYVGEFGGHTIELVRNRWTQTLSLLIDGTVAARASCNLPRTITLSAELEVDGARHAVVAKSVPRHVFWTTDTIEVDGQELLLTRTR